MKTRCHPPDSFAQKPVSTPRSAFSAMGLPAVDFMRKKPVSSGHKPDRYGFLRIIEFLGIIEET